MLYKTTMNHSISQTLDPSIQAIDTTVTFKDFNFKTTYFLSSNTDQNDFMFGKFNITNTTEKPLDLSIFSCYSPL